MKFDIYQIVIILLSVAIVSVIGLFAYNLTQGGFGKAALSVDVANGKGSVLVNGEDKGETPVYTEEIRSGNLEVEIKGQNNSYKTIIKPAAGTLAVIKRDLGVNGPFSSGQNIWFTKSGEEEAIVSIISPDVDEVSIVVDGVEMGKTPKRFSVKDLLSQSPENKYTITLKKDGYENQEVQVKVREGYELNIRADMFLKPLPSEISTLTGLPEGIQFINLSKVTEAALTDRQAWAKAINYWFSTRGAQVIGNTNVEKFDFFVADNGKVYNSDGNEIEPTEMKLTESGKFVAYLGGEESLETNDAAKTALAKALGQEVTTTTGGSTAGLPKIKISTNTLGFLRVRSGAGTGNSEIGRVDIGKEFQALEEQAGWYKIEYEAGKQGWVSGTYVEKLAQ